MCATTGGEVIRSLEPAAIAARLETKLRALTTTLALGQADQFTYPQGALLARLDELLKMSEALALALEIRTG